MSDQVYDKRIIYPSDEGGVSIIIPSLECTSIDRLIQDVPTGKPYQVLNVSEIPNDRTYRNAWTYEEG
jgi:hypothetical protein